MLRTAVNKTWFSIQTKRTETNHTVCPLNIFNIASKKTNNQQIEHNKKIKLTRNKREENPHAFSLADTIASIYGTIFCANRSFLFIRKSWKNIFTAFKTASTQSLHLLRNLPITHSVTHSHQSIKSFATLHGNFTSFFFLFVSQMIFYF